MQQVTLFRILKSLASQKKEHCIDPLPLRSTNKKVGAELKTHFLARIIKKLGVSDYIYNRARSVQFSSAMFVYCRIDLTDKSIL